MSFGELEILAAIVVSLRCGAALAAYNKLRKVRTTAGIPVRLFAFMVVGHIARTGYGIRSDSEAFMLSAFLVAAYGLLTLYIHLRIERYSNTVMTIAITAIVLVIIAIPLGGYTVSFGPGSFIVGLIVMVWVPLKLYRDQERGSMSSTFLMLSIIANVIWSTYGFSEGQVWVGRGFACMALAYIFGSIIWLRLPQKKVKPV